MGDVSKFSNIVVKLSGDPRMFGYFSGTKFNPTEGVILSTGLARDAAVYPQLDTTGTSGSFISGSTDFGMFGDEAKVTITFTAPSAGIPVHFGYVFASNELPAFGGSAFNDNLLITFNGQPGAYLPNAQKSAVTINNLASQGKNPAGFSPYYINNTQVPGVPPIMGYYGYTRALQANATTIAGDNTVIISVKDITDNRLDSAVFLVENSFSHDTAGPTPPYHWVAGDWQACIAHCGKGTQSRLTTCFDSLNVQVSDGYCIDGGAAVQPDWSRGCTSILTPVCPTLTWQVGSWGVCTKSCDTGTQKRTITCLDAGVPVDPATCIDNGVLNPVDTQTCNTQSCGFYRVTPWSVCSASCGGGVFTRSVTCVNALNLPMPSTSCEGLAIPESFSACNVNPCGKVSFVVSGYGPCSVSCGTGKMVREVNCVDANGVVQSSDTPCLAVGLVKNDTEAPCSFECIRGYTAIPSDWGACSKQCNTGTRDRTFTCYNSQGQAVLNSFCVAPILQSVCNTQPCEPLYWRTGDWTPCSATCGGGLQNRTLDCVTTAGLVVSDSLCPSPSPPFRQGCNQFFCVSYRWKTSAWSDCSSSCGDGVQRRTVDCYNNNDDKSTESLCLSPTTPRPADNQKCNLKPCPTVCSYKPSAWNPCSATCNGGVRQRAVPCVDSSNNEAFDTCCVGQQKPNATEVCNTATCATYVFVTKEFGKCSKTCGGGILTREVVCISSLTNAPVDYFLCTGLPPNNIEQCNTDPCRSYSWRIQGYRVSGGVVIDGGWTTCPVTCGGSTHYRIIDCILDLTGAKVDNSLCDPTTKPLDTEPCGQGSCLQYRYVPLPWTQCTHSRSYNCVDQNNNVVANALCGAQQAPATDGVCGTDSSGVDTRVFYRTGNWSACSVACGGGTRSRTVRCVNLSGAEVAATSCAGFDVPVSSEPCNTHLCSGSTVVHQYNFATGPWTACSATCGSGIRFRNVQCSSDQPVCTTSAVCSGTKPSDSEACSAATCAPVSGRDRDTPAPSAAPVSNNIPTTSPATNAPSTSAPAQSPATTPAPAKVNAAGQLAAGVLLMFAVVLTSFVL